MRAPGLNALVLGQWFDRADGERTTAWCSDAFQRLRPFAGERRYLNYLGDDEDPGAASVAAYGPNLPRLRMVKRRFDPDNIFHHNVNIIPA
jgi:FAD/FMN-containing dehydrogenase